MTQEILENWTEFQSKSTCCNNSLVRFRIEGFDSCSHFVGQNSWTFISSGCKWNLFSCKNVSLFDVNQHATVNNRSIRDLWLASSHIQFTKGYTCTPRNYDIYYTFRQMGWIDKNTSWIMFTLTTRGRLSADIQYRLSIDRQCRLMYLSTVGRHGCRYSVGGIEVICRWHSGHKTKCLKQWYCIALLSSYYEGRGEKENRHNSLNIKRNGLKFHTVLKKYTTNKYEYCAFCTSSNLMRICYFSNWSHCFRLHGTHWICFIPIALNGEQ